MLNWIVVCVWELWVLIQWYRGDNETFNISAFTTVPLQGVPKSDQLQEAQRQHQISQISYNMQIYTNIRKECAKVPIFPFPMCYVQECLLWSDYFLSYWWTKNKVFFCSKIQPAERGMYHLIGKQSSRRGTKLQNERSTYQRTADQIWNKLNSNLFNIMNISCMDMAEVWIQIVLYLKT